ncbi:MAG: hypothetical protein IPN36_02360 [Bacteroidetes bacterium]|nr:hypothetical protein [Bacteroidota bacterium]
MKKAILLSLFISFCYSITTAQEVKSNTMKAAAPVKLSTEYVGIVQEILNNFSPNALSDMGMKNISSWVPEKTNPTESAGLFSFIESDIKIELYSTVWESAQHIWRDNIKTVKDSKALLILVKELEINLKDEAFKRTGGQPVLNGG